MDVEVAEAAVVADVVRELGLLRRPPEVCLRSRQLLQLNAETMPHAPPAAAAQRGNNAAPPPAPGANNPKLLVYAVPN